MSTPLLDLLRAPALAREFSRLAGTLPVRHLALVAAQGGEGVSTVALLLASSLAVAASSPRVLLAEGNLRQPALARELGLQGPGLLDWDGQGPLPLQTHDALPGVDLLTAGGDAAPPALDDAAIAARLAAAAQRVRAQAACAVWDSPPLARYPDLLALAPHCDGALAVVEMDHTRVDQLRYLRDTLERAALPLLGSVVNRSGRYWPRAPRDSRPVAPRPAR